MSLTVIDGAAEGGGPTLVFDASADAHHALSEYHAYAALAAVAGLDVAEEETGAPLAVHAARLAAAMGELLGEHAALSVLAAEVCEIAVKGAAVSGAALSRGFAYFDAMRDIGKALDDALGRVRAEQDAGRLTPAEAAAERVGLLERHLSECQRLRLELSGGEL